LEKKRQEKEYFSKMLDENKKNQEIQKILKEKERQEDIRA
jgi:restriction endonuclease